MRLPRPLDEWFSERLERHAERSPSEFLVQLIHGGLRLREGYMAIHRRVLEEQISSGETDSYAAYVRCLTDTFGHEYVAHLEKWLAGEGIVCPTLALQNEAVVSTSDISATSTSGSDKMKPIGRRS